MNHIYHSIWNAAVGAWIAVSEITKGRGKRSTNRRKLLASSLLICSASVSALPTGDTLISGQAAVSKPSAGLMQINQSSQNAIIDWQGFSINANESVNIQQPNAQAALLNRVVGQDASQIQGQLNANGQVYLVNPNGVLFSKTAQVDVGGLIATTHNISNADFMNGKPHFTQDGATGRVDNQGSINTSEGGVVALIGDSVSNSGTINTPKGTTALAAGKTVDLDFKGDGLVEVKVTEAALNAQITNKGAIQADGGRVILTAKAAGQLIDTVINQDGIIRAQGMTERNGEIILDGGDNGITQVSGTLDASGKQGGQIVVTGDKVLVETTAKLDATGNTGGGNILVGGSWQNTDPSIAQATATVIKKGAVLDASATDNGNGGTVVAWSNIHDPNSATRAWGTFLATGGVNGGDGGRIETSGHWLNTDGIKVDVSAPLAKAGLWLLDPWNVTIAATGATGTPFANLFTPSQDSIILAADISTALNSGNVTISTGTTGASAGDINVNSAVNWSNNLLTLKAQRDININANLNSSGGAQLALKYDQANTGGNYTINNGAKVTLPTGENFTTLKGSNPLNVKNYTVITSLGSITDATTAITPTTLQGMALTGNLTKNYVLGADIDASATSSTTWNATGAGFMPIGNETNAFTGNFDGLGHTITGLNINRPSTKNVGLFGYTDNNVVISNVGLVSSSIVGKEDVGGLVGSTGWNNTISNAYMTGSVRGTENTVGGLVGDIGDDNHISNVYAIGNVSGIGAVGGLAGYNHGGSIITNAYATGDVTGTGASVGGLVGRNEAIINTSYATGNVRSTYTSGSVGGLVGSNFGTIENAYATGSVTGSYDVGGLVGMNYGGIINKTYATGSMRGSSAVHVGGLVGENIVAGAISNSFWNIPTTFQSNSVGFNDAGIISNTIGKNTTDMMQLATFTNAGWSISGIGGNSAVWRIYQGYTAPLLHYWLKPLTVDANITETYDGLIHNSLSNASYSIAGAENSGHFFYSTNPYGNAINVGSYPLIGGLYSDQQGYDISLVSPTNILTIVATHVIPEKYEPVIPPMIPPTVTPPEMSMVTLPVTPTVVTPPMDAPKPIEQVLQVKQEQVQVQVITQVSPLQASTIFQYTQSRESKSEELAMAIRIENGGIKLPEEQEELPESITIAPTIGCIRLPSNAQSNNPI